MILKPRFTSKELQVVIELLEEKGQELPHEIHHTDAMEMRRELRGRLRTIERLVERLRSEVTGPTSPEHPEAVSARPVSPA